MNSAKFVVVFNYATSLKFSNLSFGATLTFNCAIDVLLVVVLMAICMLEYVLGSLEVFADRYNTLQDFVVVFNHASQTT